MSHTRSKEIDIRFDIPGLISVAKVKDLNSPEKAPQIHLKFESDEYAYALETKLKLINNAIFYFRLQRRNIILEPQAKLTGRYESEYHSSYDIYRALIQAYGPSASLTDINEQEQKKSEAKETRATELAAIIKRIPGTQEHKILIELGTPILSITFHNTESLTSFRETVLSDQRASISMSGDLSHYNYIKQSDIAMHISAPKSTDEKPHRKTFNSILTTLDKLYPEQIAPSHSEPLPIQGSSTLKTVHRLMEFLEEEAFRIAQTPLKSFFKKGSADKAHGFNLLREETSLLFDNITEGKDSLQTADCLTKDLIKKSALIAHHKRYSKWNRLANICTFGLAQSESTSWKNWKKVEFTTGLFQDIHTSTLRDKTGRSVKIGDAMVSDYNTYRTTVIRKTK